MATIFVKDEIMEELAQKAFGYKGKKYKIVAQQNYYLNNYWSEGSIDRCVLVKRENLEIFQPSQDVKNPFNAVAHQTFEIPVGCFIIEYSTHRGKDFGIAFYVRPDEMPQDLTGDKTDFTLAEKVVLCCYFGFKSSYAGIKDFRKNEGCKIIPSDKWDAAKESLIARGFISKRNSLTIEGKNEGVKYRFYDLMEESRKTKV